MKIFEIPSSLQGAALDRFMQKRNPTLIGIDEVGRGALAGPVVTCAISLKNSGLTLEGLNDSKKLSANQRQNLFPKILSHTRFLGIGVGLREEIDHINIFQATKLAMYRALDNLQASLSSPLSEAILLVDGLSLEHPQWESYKLIQGDGRSPHIMAASIVAKITRDSLMALYHQKYPQFHFDKNQGYGTSYHRTLLHQQHTDIHRQTFAPLKEILPQCE